MNKLASTLFIVFFAFAALALPASAGQPLGLGGAEFVFYSAGGGASGSSSNSSSRRGTPLGGNPGVELPALVVPMISNGTQAGYFYLTMALEVRGDGWRVREKIPFIQDRLVRWVYENPIPAELTEEEALDILSEAVIRISNETVGTNQVIGLVYRDVSTGF